MGPQQGLIDEFELVGQRRWQRGAVLRGEQRAGGVGEQSPGLHQGGPIGHELGLHGEQGVLFELPPQRRLPAEASRARAGSIDDHHLGGLWRGDADGCPRAVGPLLQLIEGAVADVPGAHPCPPSGQGQALSAGASAQVEHPLARLQGDGVDEALAGGVLHLEPAVLEAGQGVKSGALVDHEAIFGVGMGRCGDSLLLQPAPQLRPGALESVGAHHGGCPGGLNLRQPCCGCRTQHLQPLAGHAVAERQSDGEVLGGGGGPEAIEAVALQNLDPAGQHLGIVAGAAVKQQGLVPDDVVDRALDRPAVACAEGPLAAEEARQGGRREAGVGAGCLERFEDRSLTKWLGEGACACRVWLGKRGPEEIDGGESRHGPVPNGVVPVGD